MPSTSSCLVTPNTCFSNEGMKALNSDEHGLMTSGTMETGRQICPQPTCKEGPTSFQRFANAIDRVCCFPCESSQAAAAHVKSFISVGKILSKDFGSRYF